MSSLAKRVRDCRYAKGWGPDELASRAEISRTALYQIESGKTELPRAGTLRRIARALDVSIDVLLGNAEVGSFQLASFAQGATTARGARPADWARTEREAYGKFPHEEDHHEVSPYNEPARTVEAAPAPAISETRELDLARKLHALLASPLGDGIARILEDSYRLLPMVKKN